MGMPREGTFMEPLSAVIQTQVTNFLSRAYTGCILLPSRLPLPP